MKRTIVTIDESKCDGCGICVTSCAEGALKIVDGKARLVNDHFCDGFGDCIGECPTGALKVETREADDYDAAATRDHVRQEKGITGLQKFEAAAHRHAASALHRHTAHKGCPGSRMRWSPAATDAQVVNPTPIGGGGIGQAIRSDLTQWPVQLHLVPVDAPFFKGRELVVLSTCSPIASADMHWRFIRGRGVVVACPKLDRTEGYVDKLAAILSEPSIPAVVVVRMAVPCCGGLTVMVRQAVAKTGRSDLKLSEVIIGLDGAIQST